jgi:hypothetical protein
MISSFMLSILLWKKVSSAMVAVFEVEEAYGEGKGRYQDG